MLRKFRVERRLFKDEFFAVLAMISSLSYKILAQYPLVVTALSWIWFWYISTNFENKTIKNSYQILKEKPLNFLIFVLSRDVKRVKPRQ